MRVCGPARAPGPGSGSAGGPARACASARTRLWGRATLAVGVGGGDSDGSDGTEHTCAGTAGVGVRNDRARCGPRRVRVVRGLLRERVAGARLPHNRVCVRARALRVRPCTGASRKPRRNPPRRFPPRRIPLRRNPSRWRGDRLSASGRGGDGDAAAAHRRVARTCDVARPHPRDFASTGGAAPRAAGTAFRPLPRAAGTAFRPLPRADASAFRPPARDTGLAFRPLPRDTVADGPERSNPAPRPGAASRTHPRGGSRPVPRTPGSRPPSGPDLDCTGASRRRGAPAGSPLWRAAPGAALLPCCAC
jgi:hypothetical protein